MFEVVQPILAMILVSVSGIVGVAISYFTRLEMDTYKKAINVWHIVLGILLLAAILVGGAAIKCPLTVGIAGIAFFGFMAVRKKNPVFRWAILGIVLGFLFARDVGIAYVISIFFVVFNFIFAVNLNIPYVLSKKKFMETRIFEQVVFLALAIVVHFALSPFF